MDFLERVLANDFSVCEKTINSFDPLAKERAKAFEPVRRAIHNQSSTIARYGFSEAATQTHQNPFVSIILKTLKRSRLEGYSLHCGNAFKILYTGGTNLSREEERSEEVYELRNKKEGFRLQFRIIEETDFGQPALHVLFLIRETDRQGSFFEIKRMLVEELWRQVLELSGFAFLYGRAIWSSNWEIRYSGLVSKDWRKELSYVGLDDNLEPILIPALRLLYYRLGFVQMGVLDDSFIPEYVALLSSTAANKIKDSIGDVKWQEINRYNHANAKIWSEIVAQRESCLEADELEKRITAKRSKMSASNR
jgi:hypothetical protein